MTRVRIKSADVLTYAVVCAAIFGACADAIRVSGLGILFGLGW